MGPVFCYGSMSSAWNRRNTAYIVSPVGEEIKRLALMPFVRKITEKVMADQKEYGLLLFTPEYLREQKIADFGYPLMCWFGLMQAHRLAVLYESLDALRAQAEPCRAYMTFHVEYPGRNMIAEPQILAALKRLPENVRVWRRSNERGVNVRDSDDTEADS